MPYAFAAAALWTSARIMLRELFFIVGAATAERLLQLTRRDRKCAREWLAALEVMVRKVLLIEASTLVRALEAPAPSPAKRHAPRSTNARAPRPPVFALIPASAVPPKHPSRVRLLGPPSLVSEIWRDAARARLIALLRNAPPPAPQARLINRISALARVIAEPSAAIRRLARVLHKRVSISIAIAFEYATIPFTFHGDANRAHHRALDTLMALNST